MVFPLDAAAWHPVRTACVAQMLDHRDITLLRWLPGLGELDDLDLTDLRGLPADVGALPPRIYHALLEDLIGSGRAKTWAELASLQVAELGRVSGLGAASLPVLLELIVDVGVRCVWPRRAASVADPPETPTPDGTDDEPGSREPDPVENEPATPESELVHQLHPLLPLLATVCTWAATEHGCARVEEALVRAASGSSPREIREVAELLRLARLPALQPPAVGSLIDGLLASLGDSRREVFEARVLPPSDATLEVLGERLGVTRERVRQIEVAVRRDVGSRLAREDSRWVRWRAHTVRQHLGSMVPVDHPYARDVMAAAIGAEATTRQTAFLMWAAGPYELQRGMWIAETRREMRVDDRLLAAIPPSGLSDESLAGVLADLDVRSVFAEDVMAWMPRVRRALGRWFVGELSVVELGVMVLHELGRPATIPEILERTGMQRDLRSLANRIQSDERFVRVSKDTYALRDWGMEEYSGVCDAIARAIEMRAGFASLSELVQELPRAFNVSAASVRAFAAAPMFVLEGDTIRMRREDEPYAVRDQLAARRRTYRYGSDVVMVVDVDREVLRGSGRPLMADVTQALGVTPGTVRRFEGVGFDAVVSWPLSGWMGGNIGSLRGAVAATSANEGQRLRLSFRVDAGTVEAEAMDDGALSAMAPLRALHHLTGAPGRTVDEVTEHLDKALGEPFAGVVATLRARGDTDVADLIDSLGSA